MPIVPGIFPVLLLDDSTDLVGKPKRAAGYHGSSLLLSLGETAMWRFGGSVALQIRRLAVFSSAESTRWEVNVNVGLVPPTLPVLDVGTEPTLGHAMNASPAVPPQGLQLGRGDQVFAGLNWYVPSGSYLHLGVRPTLAVATTCIVTCEWTDVVEMAVEP